MSSEPQDIGLPQVGAGLGRAAGEDQRDRVLRANAAGHVADDAARYHAAVPVRAGLRSAPPAGNYWRELAGIAALGSATTGSALLIVALVSSEAWGYCTGVDPGACAGSHRLIFSGWLVAGVVTAVVLAVFGRVGLVEGQRRYGFTSDRRTTGMVLAALLTAGVTVAYLAGHAPGWLMACAVIVLIISVPGRRYGSNRDRETCMILVGLLAPPAMVAYLAGYLVGAARSGQPPPDPPRPPRPGNKWPAAACLAVISGVGLPLGLQVEPLSRSCEAAYGSSACSGITGVSSLSIPAFFLWGLASAVTGLIVGLREGRRRCRFAQGRWGPMVLVGGFSPLALALYGAGYGIGRALPALSPDLPREPPAPSPVPATSPPLVPGSADTRTADPTQRTATVAHQRRPPGLPGPAADATGRITIDRASRPLLAVAGLFSGLYAMQMLIDIARPRPDPSEPLIGVLGPYYPVSIKVAFWLVVTSWLITIGILIWRWTRGDAPVLRLMMATALLLPLTAGPLNILRAYPVVALACLPTTGLALLGVYRLQRLRRVPLRLFLAVFGWGMLIGYGFGAWMNTWTLDYGFAYFGGGRTDPTQLLHTSHNAYTAAFASAGLFEELGKGSSVLLAYLLFRRYFDGVVSGVILGAAAGLGFNLVESVAYITANYSGFQFWTRQSVGIMAAHTAFSAILGAAFGVARRLDNARLRRVVIGCGYLGAAGTHFGNDTLLRWWGHAEPHGWTAHPTLDMLLVTPTVLAVLQGPFVVLYLLLVRLGLRRDAHALAHAMHFEADTGAGAVTEPEIPVLLNPATRLWLHVTMFRRYRWAGYRAVSRLHTAQYDLAARLAHGPDDGPADDALRAAVLARRQRLAAVVGDTI